MPSPNTNVRYEYPRHIPWDQRVQLQDWYGECDIALHEVKIWDLIEECKIITDLMEGQRRCSLLQMVKDLDMRILF